MRSLARLVALLAVVVGVIAVIKPEILLALGDRIVAPIWLYAIGAVRVVVGIVLVLVLVLVLVARQSRTPALLRVIGVVVVLAGLALPVVGVERTHAIVAWEARQSGALLRLAGLFIVAFASFLAFSVSGTRRSA